MWLPGCHDQPVGPAIVIALGVSIVALVGAVVAMVALRMRGRSVPTWLIRCSVTLLGLQSGLAGIVFIRQPVMLVSITLQTAVLLWFLWRSGRRATSGLLLLTTGLLGFLWWGYFLVQDLVTAADLYEPVLWAWWAPSALAAAAGVVLLTLGDKPADRPMMPKPEGMARDPMVIANAIAREASFGPIPLAGLLADGTGLLVVAVGISLWGGLAPWPVAWIVGTVVYAAIATELFYFATAPRLRRAWEGMSLVGRPEMDRWQAETGTPVPTSAAAMQRWLAEVPDRPETRWARAELQATVGDLEGARRSAAGMPLASDADRFEQQSLLGWFDWLAGGEQDLDALDAAAATVGAPASPERTIATGRAALARARDLAARGEDWKGPLVEYASAHEGRGFLRADLRRARIRAEVPLGLVMVGGVVLMSNLVR
jgi:hypothetical protein